MNLDELATETLTGDGARKATAAMEKLGQTAAETGKALYGLLLETPETEQEYLHRRLDMLLNGPHPGPAEYVKVRNDRKKWEALNG